MVDSNMNSSSPPLVSIIMPAYNAERFIEESMDSVLKQTYPHWELLVVDDGSTDSTVAQVKAFQKLDNRIELIQSPHVGYLGAVRNQGLKAAKGEFIAFMDSDDCYEQNALSTLLTYLQDTPDCTAVYGFSSLIDEHGRFITNKAYPGQPDQDNNNVILKNYAHTWRAILACDVPNAVQGLMMRRQTFERVGLQTETFNFVPDFLYYIRLFMDDFSGVHYIPRSVFRYRIYKSSNTRNQERFQEALKQIPQYCGWIFSEQGIPQEYHDLSSEIRAISYAHLTRSRLDVRNLEQLSQCILAAFFDQEIRFKHWFLYCFPYWVRYFAPSSLDSLLRTIWAAYKANMAYRSNSAVLPPLVKVQP
jgi:glycosyltransferase involved in cell wall biosynthesis